MGEDRSASRLTRVLGEWAVRIQDQSDTDATLRAIVDGAVGLVPGARWAGISLIEKRRVRARVPTDPIVGALDEAQTDLNEGPCLSALRECHTVQIVDMATETRWPQFTRLAADLGVRSLLAFQLFVRSKNLGALNLYGDHPGAFDEDSLWVGEVLAQHASVALVGASTETQLRAALANRDMISQAKGLLMARNGLDGQQAFHLLIKTSQDLNMKLLEVARYLVEQHEAQLLAARESGPLG